MGLGEKSVGTAIVNTHEKKKNALFSNNIGGYLNFSNVDVGDEHKNKKVVTSNRTTPKVKKAEVPEFDFFKVF